MRKFFAPLLLTACFMSTAQAALSQEATSESYVVRHMYICQYEALLPVAKAADAGDDDTANAALTAAITAGTCNYFGRAVPMLVKQITEGPFCSEGHGAFYIVQVSEKAPGWYTLLFEANSNYPIADHDCKSA